MDLTADIFWVVCSKICIPGNTKTDIRINFDDKASDSDIFRRWHGKYPSFMDQSDLPFSYTVNKEYSDAGSLDSVHIEINWQNVVELVRIYPEPDSGLGIDKAVIAHNNTITDYKIYPKVYGNDHADIKELNVLITYIYSDDKRKSIETKLILENKL